MSKDQTQQDVGAAGSQSPEKDAPAIIDRPCPTCGAGPREPCVNAAGSVRAGLHYARVYPPEERAS